MFKTRTDDLHVGHTPKSDLQTDQHDDNFFSFFVSGNEGSLLFHSISMLSIFIIRFLGVRIAFHRFLKFNREMPRSLG